MVKEYYNGRSTGSLMWSIELCHLNDQDEPPLHTACHFLKIRFFTLGRKVSCRKFQYLEVSGRCIKAVNPHRKLLNLNAAWFTRRFQKRHQFSLWRLVTSTWSQLQLGPSTPTATSRSTHTQTSVTHLIIPHPSLKWIWILISLHSTHLLCFMSASIGITIYGARAHPLMELNCAGTVILLIQAPGFY